MAEHPEELPISGDETEPVEEGHVEDAGAHTPVSGDRTESLPLSDDRNGDVMNLSDD